MNPLNQWFVSSLAEIGWVVLEKKMRQRPTTNLRLRWAKTDQKWLYNGGRTHSQQKDKTRKKKFPRPNFLEIILPLNTITSKVCSIFYLQIGSFVSISEVVKSWFIYYYKTIIVMCKYITDVNLILLINLNKI